MTVAAPLKTALEQFKSKDKLVSAVKALATADLWVDRTNKDKGLAHVSNAKLLRLHNVLSEVKKQFGSRAKLIEQIVAAENRGKDKDYAGRFAEWSTPRLFDYYKSAARRVKAKAAAANPVKKTATKAAPKTAAKTAAKKSTKKA